MTFFLALSLLAQTASADTITVCTTGCDHDDIGDAVADAVDGDVLELERRTWSVDGLYLYDSISLVADPDGEGDVTLDLSGKIYVDDSATVSLDELYITGTVTWAAVHNTGTLSMTDCVVSGVDAGWMPIFNSGTMSLSDSSVVDNTADVAGGIFSSGDLDVIDSKILRNTATGADDLMTGGLICGYDAVVRLKRSRVADNEGGIGGLYAHSGCEVRMTRSKVTSNHGYDNTGGVMLRSGAQLYVWTNSSVAGNTSDVTADQIEADSDSGWGGDASSVW